MVEQVTPAPSIDATSDATRFHGLDGLRAVAILMVILWHTAYEVRFPVARLGVLRDVVYVGWAGVDLFFALSGFLITTLLIREERRSAEARFSLRNFYVRRALRILPVFYAVFALLALGLARFQAFRTVYQGPSTTALWPYACFVGNYHQLYFLPPSESAPGTAFQVFWSLCVEEHFYLLWPFALTVVRGRRARLGLALTICAALPLVRYAVTAARLEVIHAQSHYRFDSLLWGAVAALSIDGAWLAEGRRRALLVVVGVACAAFVATRHLSVIPRGTPIGDSLGLSLLAIFSTLCVVDCVKRPDSFAARLLDRPALRLIGRLSYGMYLVHLPMIDVVRMLYYPFSRAATLTNLAGMTLLTTALSVALANVLHLTIERPFLRIKQRFA